MGIEVYITSLLPQNKTKI